MNVKNPQLPNVKIRVNILMLLLEEREAKAEYFGAADRDSEAYFKVKKIIK